MPTTTNPTPATFPPGTLEALTIRSERPSAHCVILTDASGQESFWTYTDARWAGDVHRVMRALAHLNRRVLRDAEQAHRRAA